MFENSALELAAAIKSKKLSVSEIVSGYLETIEKNNSCFNTFITMKKENALQRAQEIQSRIEKGETLSPLAGVPIALKDNISTMGIETTCASKMLKGYKPVYNAAVVEKLESAGLIVIGKLSMDEFTAEVPGTILNPWNTEHTAGDGSAAALAAGEVPLALGTDTGIRQPCSFCGITGIRPTYGAVSRYGIVAFTSSLEQAGPMGQNIEDNATLLSVISGSDERDSTCIIKKPFDFNEQNTGVKGIRIGIPRNYLAGEINDEVKAAVIAAAKEFEAAGAIIEEFEMPLTDYILPVYSIISSAECSSNLAKYDGLKFGYRSPDAKTLSEVYRLSRSEGFGFDVKRSIMLGSLVLSSECYETYYKKALQGRTLIKEAYNKLFKQYDIILSPVTPTTAYKFGTDNDDTRDIYTASVNLAGLPAVALPCGFDKQGLPIGFQLIGDAFTENKLINAARIYQNRTDHHTKKPRVAS